MSRNVIFRILLAVAIIAVMGSTAVQIAAATGPSSQKVEFQYGTTEKVYPTITTPNGNECGPDTDDIILQYNTYWGPRVDPDNVRWCSNSYWINLYVPVWYWTGLSSNGLSSTTTRVCMGSAGQKAGLDNLKTLYLWHT